MMTGPGSGLTSAGFSFRGDGGQQKSKEGGDLSSLIINLVPELE